MEQKRTQIIAFLLLTVGTALIIFTLYVSSGQVRPDFLEEKERQIGVPEEGPVNGNTVYDKLF